MCAYIDVEFQFQNILLQFAFFFLPIFSVSAVLRWVRAARRDANKRRSTEVGGSEGRRGEGIGASLGTGEITESALEVRKFECGRARKSFH